jgi:hypothetical protein
VQFAFDPSLYVLSFVLRPFPTLTTSYCLYHVPGQFGTVLDMSTRLDVAIDIAHALTYLHNYAGKIYSIASCEFYVLWQDPCGYIFLSNLFTARLSYLPERYGWDALLELQRFTSRERQFRSAPVLAMDIIRH